MDLTNTNYKSI